MSAVSIASNGIVAEVLSRENYQSWSALVRNYLVGKGLWDNIVEDKDKDYKDKNYAEWKSKNSKALHAIQLSCGCDALVRIRRCNNAKEAWDQLKTSFSEDVKAHHDPTQTRFDHIDFDPMKNLQILVRKGLLNDVNSSINVSPEDIFFRSSDGRTVLHEAVSAGHMELVKKLVKMGKWLLKTQDKKGYTPLALAAKLTDNKKMAKWMVDNGGQELLTVTSKEDDHGIEEIPVLLASANGHKKMTRYLFINTPWATLRHNYWEYGVVLLSRCIFNEIFDVAVAILQHPDARNLPLDHSEREYGPIYALAHIPSAFPTAGTQLNWWRKFIYIILRLEPTVILTNDERIEIVSRGEADEEGPNIITHSLAGLLFGRFQQFVQRKILLKVREFKTIYKEKEDHHLVLEILNCLCKRISTLSEAELGRALAYDAMLQAAKYGITEFIESMRRANRELLLAMDKNERGIFAHAIVNRQDKVFRLIHQMPDKDIIASSKDKLGNNLLHIAAELGPSRYLDRITNPALQMQSELQWFLKVKDVVPRWCHEAKDGNDKTPSEVFTDNHKELLKSGQQWAKDTASSFTLVGTLIITIMFAAAFTAPGGNNGEKGTPIFLGEDIFTFFIVSDAISLVTSSSSVLMFIGILTSRYAEEDFITSLPIKLLFGLVTLFFSVAAMMCAFCAALALMLRGYYRIVIATIWLALLPILVFVPSLLRLIIEIFRSTIRFHKLFAEKKKNWD